MKAELEEDAAPRRLLGTWVRGKYRLDRIVGTGGMAVVFAATHRNKKRLAVKMLRHALGGSADMQRRFLREGYVANTVDHPGAVSVLDDDVAEDGSAFLVMELLDGAPVDKLAEIHGGKLDVATTLNIAFQALDTLSAAHAKDIVHRDIKPGNLFVTRGGQLKVLDFGIARLRDASASDATTKAGTAFGTPAYMGPEQALGKVSEVDARTDLWSVGATIFTLLTGRDVHEAETVQHAMVLAATQPAPKLQSIDPAVAPAVAAIVDRALSFAKQDRWPDAASMRDAIAVAYRELFGDTVRPAALVDRLPPPASQPDLSGHSLVPPSPSSDPSMPDPSLPEPSDPFAATLAGPTSADRVRTITPVYAVAQPASSGTTRRSIAFGVAIAAAGALAGVIGLTGMRAHSRGPEIAAATQPPASAPTAPNAVIPTATNVLPANPSATASVVPAVPPAAPATVPPSTSVGAAPAARAPAPPPPRVAPRPAPKAPAPRPVSAGPVDFDTQ
jgi:serine/threonine-protein kinase